MIKKTKNVIEEVIQFYRDLNAIRKAFPSIMRSISSLIFATESNRVAINMIAREIDEEEVTISDDKSGGNNENWIN